MAVRQRARRAASTAGPIATTGSRWLHWLAPVVVATAAALAFAPALGGGFLLWDDDYNYIGNPHFRGLGWPQVKWMFTAIHLGQYMPVTWLTVAFDYVVWGMNPVGYHLTSLLLHAATALATYAVALRVYRLGVADIPSLDRLGLGAALAALLFAIHPLRVESVVWVTERRDVLSGVLAMLTVLAYLKANPGSDGATAWRSPWYWAALGSFTLALGAKSIVLSIPVVLLLLDVYPLRRLELSMSAGKARAVLRLVTEKAPFFLLAAGPTILAVIAQDRAGALVPLRELGLMERVGIMLHSFAFYLWKSAWPFGLSPMYERPATVDVLTAPFLFGACLVVAITLTVVALRHRFPALGIVWAIYAVTLLPVAGLVQIGPQLAADRYSYLPSIALAILIGGVVMRSGGPLGAVTVGRRALVAGLAASMLAGLGTLTWRQAGVWRDSETLWRHALTTQPSGLAHYKLAEVLFRQGGTAEALDHARKAVALQPRAAQGWAILADILAHQGLAMDSLEAGRRATRLAPDKGFSYLSLGRALIVQGDPQSAMEAFKRALLLDPALAPAHNNLGALLAREGRFVDAIESFRRAIAIEPDYAPAHRNLGRTLGELGRAQEAERHLETARRLVSSPRRF